MSYYLFTLICFILHIFATQAELDVTVQHIDVVYYDREYFSFIEVIMDGDYNQAYVNLTIIKALPEDTMLHYYIKGATMGEYKIPVGIDYTFHGRDVFYDQIMVGPFFRAIGMNEYPPQPGNYGVDGYLVDVGQLPENFYPNNYMAFASVSDDDGKLLIDVHTISRVA